MSHCKKVQKTDHFFVVNREILITSTFCSFLVANVPAVPLLHTSFAYCLLHISNLQRNNKKNSLLSSLAQFASLGGFVDVRERVVSRGTIEREREREKLEQVLVTYTRRHISWTRGRRDAGAMGNKQNNKLSRKN